MRAAVSVPIAVLAAAALIVLFGCAEPAAPGGAAPTAGGADAATFDVAGGDLKGGDGPAKEVAGDAPSDAASDAAAVGDATADPGGTPPDSGAEAAPTDGVADAGPEAGDTASADATAEVADVTDGADLAPDSGAGDGGDGSGDAGPAADAGTADAGPADVGATDASAVDGDGGGDAVAKVTGCSDGTREGFIDQTKFALVAACAGAWDIAGIHKGTPACGRKAGNSGTNAAGKGCNVEDLCADGWHVCYGAKDLKERNPLGCAGILDGGGMSPSFFLARSSSTGAFNCSQDSTKFGDPGTSNDLFGCGDLGCPIDFKTYPSCDPLNRASHDLCKGLRNDLACGDWCSHLGKFPGQKNTWDCGKNTTNEANVVVKSDPLVQGGVLCCSDSIAAP